MVQEQLVRRYGFLLGLIVASPAFGQERITPDAFLDTAVGKTLTFEMFGTGRVVGREEFLNRKLSVWREEGDTCVYGRITIEKDQLCFYYDHRGPEDPACWWTFRDEDRLLVLFAGDGEREIQEVTRIDESGLDCPVKPGV
jgi:hypothetical protein